MSEAEQAVAEAQNGPITKETLFPDGQPGSRERKAFLAQEGLEAADSTDGELETAEPEVENLAEAQDVETGEGEMSEAEQEVALGRMELNEFLKQAGISHEEFYRDIYKIEDGKEVSMSAAWDERKKTHEANQALLRERAELQERVNQSATRVQQQDVSPEAQTLANQAQMKLQQISETDWSQVDPGMAANMKFDLQAQANQLWQQAQGEQAEHQQKLQENMQKALAEADRLTRSQIPEWNDRTVRTADERAIKDMLSRYGIPEQEADSVIDPRWRRVLRDAMKANATQARLQAGAKKVQKVGRTVAPGARVPVSKTPTLRGARAALNKAKDNGANKEQMARERLAVTLPDVKPVKRVR